MHAALERLRLDAVWVIPAGLPVHRQLSDLATPAQRLAWMQRIFADDARVLVSDWEVREQQPTPSIVTLRRFVREFPEARPVLLLGADAFAGMDGWVDYPEHAGMCDVAVFGRASSRSGDAVSAFRSLSLAEWLGRREACGCRVDVDATLPDVSATAIRRMALSGERLAGRVPACVSAEIEQAYAAKPA